MSPVCAQIELSSAYKDYLYYLRILECYISSGLDKSKDAKVLRDKMDAPWYAMTYDERQMIRERDIKPAKPVPDAIDDEKATCRPRENCKRVHGEDGVEFVEEEE